MIRSNYFNGVFFVGCLLAYSIASAQVTNDPSMLIKNRGAFGYITTFEPDAEIEGDYFFSEESIPMTLHLTPTKDPYKVEKGNINLLDFSILIDFEGSTYAVQPLFVDSLFMDGSWLLNTRHIAGSSEPNQLFFLLHRGKSMTLHKEQKMELLQPTYVEALQVGNRNYTLQPRLKYYCVTSEGLRYDVTKNISDFKKEPFYAQLKKFYKGQNLDPKKEEDLIRLAKYLDSLVSID